MTPSAGWSISSLAEPTNFDAGDSQDDVLAVGVHATGGTYKLGVGAVRELTGTIAWNATAAELQQRLEAVPTIGAGNVTVTGGEGSEPYVVTFVGALIGREIRLELSDNELTGGEATVTIKMTQKPVTNDRYVVTVVNTGTRASEGEVTIKDELPPGVTPVDATITEPLSTRLGACTVAATVTCTYNEPAHPVRPGGELVLTLYVAVLSPSITGPLTNHATVSGGGGDSASVLESTAVNIGPAPFGVDQFSFETSGLDGEPDLQAGNHPAAVTTTLVFNSRRSAGAATSYRYHVAQEAKDVAVDLPLGFVGDPLAAERCPEIDLTDQEGTLGGNNTHTSCPAASRVGMVRVIREGGETPEADGFPVYNLAPEHGYPAELGFNAGLGQPIFLYASVVRGPSGYRLRVATPGALRAVDVEGVVITIFGNPGEHDGTRGSEAFITNPTRCSGEPLSASAEVTSWEGGSGTAEATAYPEISGCDLLQGPAAFDPSIELAPKESQADTPSGYKVDLKVPQAPDAFDELATPQLKDATVTLPAGVSISPSAASGPDALEGCNAEGPDGINIGSGDVARDGEDLGDPEATELGEGHPGGDDSPYDDGMWHTAPGHCPARSQIGSVEVQTPLLEEALRGHVYVAEPDCGGAGQSECTEQAAEEGKVFGLYLEVAGSGVIVKLAGSVEVGGYGGHNNLAIGQLRARFDDNPQFPFEDFRLTFTGGQRAALANPQSCGTFTTTSDLEPWSTPESGPNATPSSAFTVTGCANPMPFTPGFTAGMLTPIAGGYSPFILQLTRQDGEQDLAGVSVTMPAGLEGTLSKVTLCGEPQAALGTCSSASQIGTATVASGAGTQPLWLSGPVYLTGPYKGAPFGLSVVVPAKAGPYNLGNVVVRSAINVNPNNAQLTVTSDPLPQSVDGVPFRLKTIDVEVSRPEFTFNPTNCDSQSVTGTISAAQGASSAVSSPFAVTGCKNLPFKPGFTASTQGETSKADGASLVVKVAQKPGEANIHRVDLQLPLSLPSRLTTLQKACTEAQFDANPAGCPAGSVIGTAIAHTPVLNVPLSGPAYLVSHGGAAFPDVEFILQGEGVTIVVDGKTQIKKGITYSHFETVPDAPISSFETTLPEGSHSVLGTNLPANANGSFCGLSLAMPTMIEGQNGAQTKQSTTVAVTGCKAAINIVKKKRFGGKVLLTLRSTVAGTLTITGSGVKNTKQTVVAGEHQVEVALTSAGRRRRTIKLKIILKSGKSTLSKAVKL